MQAPETDGDKIEGQQQVHNHWPYDSFLSFVFRHRPSEKTRARTRIMEIGCGVGSNLWQAASEGVSVAGIDANEDAIKEAKKRFHDGGLHGDLHVGDYRHLPFGTNTFDLVIDHAAISGCGKSAARQIVAEVRRVLTTDGKFLFCPYSDRHSLAKAGQSGPDGQRTAFKEPHLVGVDQLAFYTFAEVERVLGSDWMVLSWERLEVIQQFPRPGILANWWIVVQKLCAVSG